MSDDRKDLPPVNSPNFLEKVREALGVYLGNRGDKMDRGVTLRDLTDSGIVTLRPGYTSGVGRGLSPISGAGSNAAVSNAYEADLTPPPTPSGFTASAAISNIFIGHDSPIYTQGHGHSKTVVYGATWVSGALPVFANAVVLTEFSGSVFSHSTNPATTWHLWTKWVTVDGVASINPAGGTNGLVVTTGQDVSRLVEAMTGPGNPFKILAVDTVIDGVTYPAGTYTTQAFIRDLQVTNAKIGNLAVDDAKVANLSVSKLTAGSLAVGQFAQSTSYVSGSSGWRINGDGAAEFSNVTVRGTVHASAGSFTGSIQATSGYLQGLEIRQANGTVLMSAGNNLSFNQRFGGTTGTTGLPADNATVGATWGSNLSGQPSDAALLNSYATIGQNLIPNSDQTSFNTFGAYWYGAIGSLNNLYASSIWADIYALRGTVKNLVSYQGAPYPGGDTAPAIDLYPMTAWDTLNSVPVVVGQRYMFSAYLQSHRCGFGVGIQFFNAAGVFLTAVGPDRVAGTEGNADTLAAYQRLFCSGVAPVGASHARVYIRKYNTYASNGDSFIWYAAPQFEAVMPNATGPSPYTAGPANSTRQLGYTGALNATANQSDTATNTAIAAKLNNSGANVMASTFFLQTNGYAGGNGVALYDGGIIARTGGVNKFVLSSDGNAAFSGSLSGADISGATGTFGGALQAGVLDVSKLVGQLHSFTTAGSYSRVVPADFTQMRLVVVGGGGNGGTGVSYGNGGGGGGGGATIIATFTVTPGQTIYANVGADGATSSVASYVTALPGGAGGNGVSNGGGGASGAGGTSGTVNGTSGGAGGAGSTGGQFGSGKDATSTPGYTGAGGAGGRSPYATAGRGGNGGTAGAGTAGSHGQVLIEFFNPNGVIIRSEWNTLQSALSRQGIATV